MGLPGGNSGNLIVGAEDGGYKKMTKTPGMFTYAEINLGDVDAADVRYRLSAIGMDDQEGTGGTFSASALFVGQGVDGPLGVIGTWALNDPSVARLNAAGAGADDFDDNRTPDINESVIHGAFGTEIP